MTVREREKEREKERERKRDRHRERERQTDRQGDTEASHLKGSDAGTALCCIVYLITLHRSLRTHLATISAITSRFHTDLAERCDQTKPKNRQLMPARCNS
jgi:hypothetical protein